MRTTPEKTNLTYDPDRVLSPLATMYDRGYTRQLVKDDPFYDDQYKTKSKVESAVAAETIQPGRVLGITMISPVITDFAGANHTHESVEQGGRLNASNVFGAGVVPDERIGPDYKHAFLLMGA